MVPRPESGKLGSDAIQNWNTRNLGLRVATDAASAATASVLVAPVICLIDQSVVRKVASGASISKSFLSAGKSALLRPHHFLLSRPFLLIFSLYYSTYFTANTVDTLTSTFENKSASNVTSGPTKFAATSAVNMSLSVYKDTQFAKIFGSSTGPAAQIPKVTYAIFACRDSLTIFASFNLPTMIAPRLAELPPQVKSKFSSILSTESGRTSTAQFIAPAVMQIFNTPLHLLGLDLYNRQGRVGFSERALQITRNWAVSSFARMGRVVPAFGVGGVVNLQMRSRTMKTIEQ